MLKLIKIASYIIIFLKILKFPALVPAGVPRDELRPGLPARVPGGRTGLPHLRLPRPLRGRRLLPQVSEGGCRGVEGSGEGVR